MKPGAAILSVDTVRIGGRRRPLRLGKVQELADSIRQVRLLNPIVVTTELELVAGLHRLEAFRLLGRTQIPVTVVSLDEIDRELAELDENLARNELTTLERGEALARRKELYESKHPETRPGAFGGGREGVGARTRTEITPGVISVPNFSESAAKLTGQSPTTIYDQIRIAKQLDPDVKDQIRDTPLANQKRNLLKLAAKSPEEQRAAVSDMIAASGPARDAAPAKKPRGRRSPKSEIEHVNPVLGTLRHARSQWRDLVVKWDDQKRFDMLWAVQSSQEIVAKFDAVIAAVEAVASRCASGDDPPN